MKKSVYVKKKCICEKKEVLCVCVCMTRSLSLFKVFKLNIKFDSYFRVWNKKM